MKNFEIKNNDSLARNGKESQSGRTLLPESGADAPTVLSAVYTDSTPAKNRQADVPQYGRSMIEMLGVLAIIGVLSVGGIAGYSKAMQKYRINKTIEQITLIAGNIRTFFSTQKDYSQVPCYYASPKYGGQGCSIIRKAKLIPDEMISYASDGSITAITNAYGGTFSLDVMNKSSTTDTKAFRFSLYGLPQEACIDIATQDWSSNSGGSVIELVINSTSSPGSTASQYIGNCTSTANDFCANDMPISIDKAVTACDRDNNFIDIKFY